jgi:hypothetical protein
MSLFHGAPRNSQQEEERKEEEEEAAAAEGEKEAASFSPAQPQAVVLEFARSCSAVVMEFAP